MLGAVWTRRRQQAKVETLQLVVRSMRRPIQLESAHKILVVSLDPTQTKRKSWKHVRHHGGLCDDLVNALKLLANQQKDGDSPIQSIVTGLHERSRRGIMDG